MAARQVVGDFAVPYGFELWGDGVYTTGEGASPEPAAPDITRSPPPKHRAWLTQVARRPIWIRSAGRVLDTEEALVELCCLGVDGSPRAAWASRLDLADRRRLVALLAPAEFPVRAGNAAIVEEYLDRALHDSAGGLPTVLVAARSGAYEVDYVDARLSPRRAIGWLVGDRWIGPARGPTVRPDPRRTSTWIQGTRPRGSLAEWVDVYKTVGQAGPLARWLTGTVFGAPLCRLVGDRTFVVHHWGAGGRGKTALLRFAMTAMGDPQVLLAHHDRTEISYTEVFATVSDLLVGFDELQAGTTSRGQTPLAYKFALEKGRARARSAGGLEAEIGEWRTIVRMTGEEPIVGERRLNLGGEGSRVVEVRQAVLDEDDAKALNVWATHGPHGLALPVVLAWLVEMELTDVESPVLKAAYEGLVEGIGARQGRRDERARHLAVGALGAALADHVLAGDDLALALERARDDAAEVARIIAEEEAVYRPVWQRALQLLQDHVLERRSEWLDLTRWEDQERLLAGAHRGVVGFLTAKEMWLVPSAVDRLLRREELPPRRVWADLDEAGWLVRDGDDRVSSRLIGSKLARVYVVKRS